MGHVNPNGGSGSQSHSDKSPCHVHFMMETNVNVCYVFASTRADVVGQESAERTVVRNGLLSETRKPFHTAPNNCNANSDKSPPNGFLSEADGCPKTENSDSDKSPFRTRVRLPWIQ